MSLPYGHNSLAQKMNKRKKRRSPKTQFEFLFHPLGFVDGVEYEQLSKQLQEQVQVPVFNIRVLQRRETWAIELPRGAFTGDLSGAATEKDDLIVRDAIVEQVKGVASSYEFSRKRHIFLKDDVWYYRKPALAVFRNYARPNELMVAAYNLISQAEADPTVIKGERPRRGRIIKDGLKRSGPRGAGPRWLEKDDYVLKKWFGKWPDGKHHPLTEAQWLRVLDELGNFRNKQAVRRRLTHLNAKLKASLLRDGYIHHDDVKKYTDGFLGERVVVPRFRPRLHGSYYPEPKRGNPFSTLRRSDGTLGRRPRRSPLSAAAAPVSHLDALAEFSEAKE